MKAQDKLDKIENAIISLREEISEMIKSARAVKTWCGKCNEGHRSLDIPTDFPRLDMLVLGDFCECTGFDRVRYDGLLDTLRAYEAQHLGAKARVAYLRSCVGDTYMAKTIADYNDCSGAKDALRKWWADGCSVPIIIMGKTGTGKTHLLAALMNEFTAAGKPYQFIRADQLDLLTNLDLHRTDEREHRVKELSTVPHLFIDDVAKSKMTEALYSRVWFPILESRRNNALPTVYTSDKMTNMLWEHYDDQDNIAALITRMKWVESGTARATEIILRERAS